jgi:hypothetical protein
MSTSTKIYRFYGVNGAIELLRPGAKWEWTGGVGFTRWDDERPKPTKEEVEETMEKIKEFEDSINTIWTKEQLEEIGVYTKAIEESSL